MRVIKGNIFRTTHQTIVNTVNCFGIMGAGLALECKYRYPDMFIRYKDMCDKHLFDIGKLYLYKTHQKWILNFPTKKHWKFETKPEYIERGLKKFVETYQEKGIKSIAFPLLGSHNGGLSQDQSLSMLNKYLSDIDIPIEIYEYDENSVDDLFTDFKTAFLTYNNETLRKLTFLKEDRLKKIKDILETGNLNSMSQLILIDGIGESTIEKCFNYAMRPDSMNVQLNLF